MKSLNTLKEELEREANNHWYYINEKKILELMKGELDIDPILEDTEAELIISLFLRRYCTSQDFALLRKLLEEHPNSWFDRFWRDEKTKEEDLTVPWR